ncbi:P-loop containing nucleoside triphosphate hydrolase protein [Talaromyces proteolyticus]|uniref:P-loop containing nucleoside triphosphate hydrolase protein n=1 Tax=Talaromyces proteolyticus TaxID=1131652 RepID=A0AAD4PYW1_9EURO|nr:P-loop containing nucleoside triphosphate hydrolase protein [Talaromyces proteolyticus]KAH8698381.1 P-loop containing nucleoside triphosphate hydrolase protein [Talaromyces proteolyticus]
MDLLFVLPDFSTKQYTHILPPLERKHITTADLITLDTLELAKRAHVPPADVRRLSADVVAALHASVGIHTDEKDDHRAERIDLSQWRAISTLDPTLDELLGGGIPTGYLTEITGESGSGKTQFLLNLLLTTQLPPPNGIAKNAIYISTEAPLSTPRLSQLLANHPYLANLEDLPSLTNILAITAVDLETQDHILNYQLPVAISRFNVGLVVIDSITANYRAEHASNSMHGLSVRSGELAKLGHMLRNLAARENIAVVVANQVSDRFDFFDGQQQTQAQARFRQTALREGTGTGTGTPRKNNVLGDILPSSSPAPSSSQLIEDDSFDGSYIIGHPVRNETLALAHQERFFTGWGDNPESLSESQKTPALGLVWSTQVACRIVLKKDGEVIDRDSTHASSQPAQHRSEISSIPSTPNNAEKETKATNAAPPQSSQPGTGSTGTEGRGAERITRRRMKLVYAPWASGIVGQGAARDEIEFEIWKGGIRSINTILSNNEIKN